MPLAAINQLVVYDDMQDGRQSRWAVGTGLTAKDLDAYMEAALTGIKRQ